MSKDEIVWGISTPTKYDKGSPAPAARFLGSRSVIAAAGAGYPLRTLLVLRLGAENCAKLLGGLLRRPGAAVAETFFA